MSKKKQTKTSYIEAESTYVLKIVIYLLLGMLWLRLASPVEIGALSISAFPIGLIIALLFIRNDHFAIDRKIEYPLVIIATIISFFFDAGIVI